MEEHSEFDFDSIVFPPIIGSFVDLVQERHRKKQLKRGGTVTVRPLSNEKVLQKLAKREVVNFTVVDADNNNSKLFSFCMVAEETLHDMINYLRQTLFDVGVPLDCLRRRSIVSNLRMLVPLDGVHHGRGGFCSSDQHLRVDELQGTLQDKNYVGCVTLYLTTEDLISSINEGGVYYVNNVKPRYHWRKLPPMPIYGVEYAWLCEVDVHRNTQEVLLRSIDQISESEQFSSIPIFTFEQHNFCDLLVGRELNENEAGFVVETYDFKLNEVFAVCGLQIRMKDDPTFLEWLEREVHEDEDTESTEDDSESSDKENEHS